MLYRRVFLTIVLFSFQPVEKEITILEVLMLQKPEWGWLLMGFIGSVGVGLVSPIFALFYGEIFEVSIEYILLSFFTHKLNLSWRHLRTIN